MKILLDQHIPHTLRHELPGHVVITAWYAKLSDYENGRLLAEAARQGFDVLVTTDRGMEYEQNQSALPIAVVILRVESNAIESLRPLLPDLLQRLSTLRPRTLVKVGDRP